MKTDDIRITEYSLGELHGSAREQFEQELAASEEFQAELREVTAWCERLTEVSDSEEGLLDDQRLSLREECRKNLIIAQRQIITRRVIIGGSIALAACLVLMAVSPWFARSTPNVVTAYTPAPEAKAATAQKPVLITKEYKVPPGFISAQPSAATRPTAREFLTSAGVAFPPGASANFLPISQKLIVKNTQENLDLIDRLVNTYVAASSPSLLPTSGNVIVSTVPAFTPDKQTSEAIVRLLAEGRGYFEAGRYDLATKRYEQALNLDPHNLAARQAEEQVNESRAKYATLAYADTREEMQADSGWERPVRRFAAQSEMAAAALAPELSKNERNAAPAYPAPDIMTQSAMNQSQAVADSVRQDVAKGGAVDELLAQTETQSQSSKGFVIYRKSGENRNYLPQSKDISATTNQSYAAITENPFLEAKTNPLSTFSIDVDTASYANVRRILQSEQLPPADAVRIEEMLNYFPYAYPQPQGDKPFSVNVETSQAPWNPAHKLVRIGLKGREIPKADRGAANLVFLLDVSGSMEPENRLPLIKRSLEALVQNLSPQDHVAIVVYAGSSGLVLPSTPGSQRERILQALDHLQAGGSTNGADGIKLAYQTAQENFLKNGNNRVILCTDGDFNVGVTSQDELIKLIEAERNSGIFLSVLGVGEDNLKDSTMMNLADKGNGNYAYVDSFAEGRKILVEQMGGTLFTIAKDVKIQVEFNPAFVAGYRLIGYEKRLLAKEDFNDDKKDAGEIGAGHTVTALYETVPVGQSLSGQPSVDPLKYQIPAAAPAPDSTELLTLKLRYKAPTGDKSELIEVPVQAASGETFAEASPDFQFAAAVAAFGMKLRNSPSARDFTWKEIQDIARRSLGDDQGSYRAEFLTLVEKAAYLNQRASVESNAVPSR